MSIVPRQAAPVPQWAQQIYGTGAIGGGAGGGPPARGYAGTDWSRTGQPGWKMVWQPGGTVEYTDPVTGETYTMDNGGKWVWQADGGQTDGGRTAVPPGFAQQSYGSQYGPQWRGAAFGPSGRMGATSNNRATTYYGPGFEPWVDNPDTDLDTPPTLPPWWPKGGDTGGGGIGPPVIPPPDPDKPPVTDPNTDNPATGGGIAPYQSPAPYSTKPSVVTGPDGKAKNPYKWPAKITKGWV